MARITNVQSREIYELAKNPNNSLTNIQIGKKFGIDEGTVRYHIKKWERKLHEIAASNDKAANALASHAVNVSQESFIIIQEVRTSIQEAKDRGISPERLAPLYSNWIRSLELASELMGDISRSPQMNIHFNQQFNEFMNVILEETDGDTRDRIVTKLSKIIS